MWSWSMRSVLYAACINPRNEALAISLPRQQTPLCMPKNLGWRSWSRTWDVILFVLVIMHCTKGTSPLYNAENVRPPQRNDTTRACDKDCQRCEPILGGHSETKATASPQNTGKTRLQHVQQRPTRISRSSPFFITESDTCLHWYRRLLWKSSPVLLKTKIAKNHPKSNDFWVSCSTLIYTHFEKSKNFPKRCEWQKHAKTVPLCL